MRRKQRAPATLMTLICQVISRMARPPTASPLPRRLRHVPLAAFREATPICYARKGGWRLVVALLGSHGRRSARKLSEQVPPRAVTMCTAAHGRSHGRGATGGHGRAQQKRRSAFLTLAAAFTVESSHQIRPHRSKHSNDFACPMIRATARDALNGTPAPTHQGTVLPR
jgi:hypothetical protein